MNAVSSEKRKYRMKARAEAQEETRRRIAAAAAELHEEQGVARTTVAEIARRAGVQRLTVYNHFPELSDLLPACNAHYSSLHPFPDLDPARALEDPRERVRAALVLHYGWYRETQQLLRHIHGDRTTVPEVDALMRAEIDAPRLEVADELAAGFGLRGKRAERLRALIALALEFWTWNRLDAEGLDDEEAAELMAAALCAVTPRS
ncbi:MAG TPA: TetR/AcrR family transcriptional regulator [Solirubrobacterales bacterium]|nr:TetR/AcrR family transcriptional regulator [Solirubrobacterales bacterium]